MAQFNDANQAKQTIEKWRASGLGVIPFTKREGISVWRFYQMRKMVDAADPCIVPVVVRSGPMPAPTVAASPFEVELTSGMKIRVAAGFDATELVRLVEALGGARC